MRASQSTIDLLAEYYAAMEVNDRARFGTYYSDDMTVTFANNPRIEGAAAFLAALTEMLSRVRSVHHDVIEAWEEEGGLLIFESLATWTLLNGTQLSIAACSVCTMVDGRFTDQRIYVDNAPLFAALEQTDAAEIRGE